MNEVWKPVIGFEASYDVSSLGRVRRRSQIRPDGGALAERLLKLQANHGGYSMAALSRQNKTVMKSVHVMVLEAHVGPRVPGQQTRHLNGVRTDNRIENLSWGSAKQNARDKVAHGTNPNGERHPGAKLTAGCVDRIRDMRKHRVPVKALALQFGVSKSAIIRAAKGRLWKTAGLTG